MRKKNYIKLSIISILTVAAITPTVVLTSCSTTSQWNLPIMIGSVGANSPWAGLRNDIGDGKGAAALNGSDSKGYATTPGDDTNPDNTYYSPSEKFGDYLPDAYISFTDPKVGTSNYAYVTPYDDKNWNSFDDDINKSAYHQSKWAMPTDADLNFSEKFSVKKENNTDILRTQQISTSMRNFNIMTSFGLDSIASTANLFNSGLLQFMSQNGVVNSSDAISNSWFNALFGDLPLGDPSGRTDGGFDHYLDPASPDKTELQNKEFYEFLYDSLNLLGEGNFAAKFGESSLNYQLSSYTYGPGPYVSYENETDGDSWHTFGSIDHTVTQAYDWYTTPNRTFNYSLNGGTVSASLLSNGAIDPTFVRNGETEVSGDPSKASTFGAYVSFSDYYPDTAKYNYNDSKKSDTFYPAAIGASESTVGIPFIINPGDTSFSYYNPIKSHSFQQKDYLINDISAVQKQVKKSNAWNSFSNHVDKDTYDKDAWAQSLKWNVATSNPTSSSEQFYQTTGADTFTKIDGAIDADGQHAKYIDPAIDNIFSSDRNIHSVSPNAYIGFATYSFLPFPKATASKTTDNPNDLQYDYLPVFQGIQSNATGTLPAIFPISMLYNHPTASQDESIDTSLFKAQMLPEATALYNYKEYSDAGYGQGSNIFSSNDDKDNFKKNPLNNMYYFDMDKLFDKETRILNVLDCNQIPKGKDPVEFATDGFRYRRGTSEYIDISSEDIKEAFYVLWHLYGNWTYDTGHWALNHVASSDFINPIA